MFVIIIESSFHLSSFIFHLLLFILHLSSFIFHPSSSFVGVCTLDTKLSDLWHFSVLIFLKSIFPLCFVYLTQCKVKKLQRRAKKTNRCSNGSTSPHLCFHRTDIHSIRSQFRHSPPMIVHFRHSKCASLPRYGQGGKGELYIEFLHL